MAVAHPLVFAWALRARYTAGPRCESVTEVSDQEGQEGVISVTVKVGVAVSVQNVQEMFLPHLPQPSHGR